MASPELAYVVPVVIDDTTDQEKGLKAYEILVAHQWIECRQGEPTREFIDRIKMLYRAHQKART